MRRDARRGFTLIELMIVVAVIGILSAIAIPAFQSYIYRSRTVEAVTFLGEIRQRQESYRAEFGQYCSVSAAPGSDIAGGAWAPAGGPYASGTKVGWSGGPGTWDQLGAAPDGLVTFQYRTTAGPPGTRPAVPGYDGTDFWYIAQARADLDADGRHVIMEAYSRANQIFICDQSYNALYSGWE